MAKNTWSAEEVEAAVDDYVTLFKQIAGGGSGTKQPFFEDLSRRYGRSVAAYNYRFRNISYVLRSMGLPTLPGSSFADHVGPTAEATIRQVIHAKGYFSASLAQPTADPEQLEQRTRALRQRGVASVPAGRSHPPRVVSEVERIVRDPAVKAWVLEQAAGHCECCGQPAPFVMGDGTPYLEVHHVKWLAQGGSDTVSNAVALCPNCHRRFHYGNDASCVIIDVISRVDRLVAE